jgi:choline dehydrogenase-like flavoprotein
MALNVVSRILGGTLILNSSDPFVYPVINPNYLNAEVDVFIMREAIRAVRRFVRAPVWKDYLNLPPDVPLTDAELNKVIASNSGNLHHPVGTAAMSAKNADYGVVDPDLRVKGVAGVRVVDASAFVSVFSQLIYGICVDHVIRTAVHPLRTYDGGNLHLR